MRKIALSDIEIYEACNRHKKRIEDAKDVTARDLGLDNVVTYYRVKRATPWIFQVFGVSPKWKVQFKNENLPFAIPFSSSWSRPLSTFASKGEAVAFMVRASNMKIGLSVMIPKRYRAAIREIQDPTKCSAKSVLMR